MLKAIFTQCKFTKQFITGARHPSPAARFFAPILLGLFANIAWPATTTAKAIHSQPAPPKTSRSTEQESADKAKVEHSKAGGTSTPKTKQSVRPRPPKTKQSVRPRSLPKRAPGKPHAPSLAAAVPKPEKLKLSVYSEEAQRSIGAISVGHPNVGFLINGVALKKDPRWVVTVPQHRFGTEETLLGLTRAIATVQEQFPHSPPVMIGSISPEGGGYAPPHKSHRSGRDVDVYFYRTQGSVWFKPPTRNEIDYPRSWALLKAFLTQTPIDYVLLDRELQTWFRDYAASIGEDPLWLKQMFEGEGRYPNPAVKHAPGHDNHFHVRFASPIARERGRLLYDKLVAQGHLPVKGTELAGAREPVLVAHFPKPGEKASSVADALSGLTAIEQEFDESLEACDPLSPVTAQQH